MRGVCVGERRGFDQDSVISGVTAGCVRGSAVVGAGTGGTHGGRRNAGHACPEPEMASAEALCRKPLQLTQN